MPKIAWYVDHCISYLLYIGEDTFFWEAYIVKKLKFFSSQYLPKEENGKKI